MTAKVALVSLRSNPAFIQFLLAYAKALRVLGHEVAFLLDPAYRRFSELEETAAVFALDQIPLPTSWTHAVFLNPSVENKKLAIRLRCEGAKILYVFHEPWQLSLRYVWGEGLLATCKAIAAHHVTVPSLKLADTVILASRYGLNEYRKGDAKFNRNSVYFPLILDDEAPGDLAELQGLKRYFSFIGGLCRAHGFDHYLAFMRYALQQDMDVRFLIASRNQLSESVLKDPILRQNLDKVEFRCGRPLGNEEMNRCYAESFCVWNVYRRSTQSAVLPKALMFGAPVLASRIGSFPEFITEGRNGRFTSGNDLIGISDALVHFRTHIRTYGEECRKTFLETFYYRSQLKDLERLLSEQAIGHGDTESVCAD